MSDQGGYYIDGITRAPAYESDGLPPPPESLGRNLITIEDARTWLQHPSNWFKSEMFVIKWAGIIPTINERHAKRLRVETHDTGLYEVVIREQYSLKHPKDKHDGVVIEPREPSDDT